MVKKWYFVEVEDEIKFTDVSEVLVENFNECVDEFQYNELIFILVDNGDEIERGVSFVDDFVVFVLYEVAHFGFSG